MDLHTALAPIGVTVEVTVRNRIATVNVPHVPAARRAELTPHVLRINEALQQHGLLGRWRAKTGGTQTESWVLLIGTR